MNGSYAGTVVEEDGLQSLQPSTRYIGSLRPRSPSKRASSAISKTYKAASTLYLTRRLAEALRTIEPLVTVAKQSEDSEEKEEEAGSTLSSRLPPVATATRSLRVKVWNFYLTLLNAIIELGPEEGKADLGGAVWKGIVNKVRDGYIWEEVVQSGYAGREGSVDADVVANLATLLLGQSQSQLVNQQRLETYLSLTGSPELALADRLGGLESSGLLSEDMQRRPSHASGANTPRDLNSRAKVLELYSLHVLPRNEEWDTSREFIRNSNELDDERKDAFLYTLDTLQEQAQSQRDHEQELLRQRDEELARQRQEAEAKRLEESRLLDERSRASEAASQTSSRVGSSKGEHHRSNSEVDYGIEDTAVRKSPFRKKEAASKQVRSTQHQQPSRDTGSGGGGGGGGSSIGIGSGGGGGGGISRGGGGKGLPRAARPRKAAPRSVMQRIPILLGLLQKMLSNMVQTMTKDPATLTRNLLFLFAFLLALARRDVRDRIGSITGAGWSKVKATVGMGTKVSYI